MPHRNCGKLIVATNDAESEKLAVIKGRAEANGVEGMRLLSAAEAMAMEPNLRCTAALLSPRTGIVDSHSTCWRCRAMPRTAAPCSPSTAR